jgi:hypothetical protein
MVGLMDLPDRRWRDEYDGRVPPREAADLATTRPPPTSASTRPDSEHKPAGRREDMTRHPTPVRDGNA